MTDRFPSTTLSVIALRPMLDALKRAGVDGDRMLRAAYIDPDLLRDPEARVPGSAARELWCQAVAATGDEDFGLHAAEAVHDGSFDLIGYVSKSSATLGNAVRRASRYMRIVADSTELELQVEGGKARLGYARPLRVLRAVADFRLVLLVRLARLLSGREIAIEEACFVHERPADISEYLRLLGIAPRFGRDRDAIVFPATWLDVPMQNADEQLCAILERQARHLLERSPPADAFPVRVRRAIAAELEIGGVSLQRVADRLRVHPRTLRRRLHDEGTTHQQLLDELRHRLALRYLDEDRRGVGEVAFLLGFADSSAFSKAFKRWTGASPRQGRRSRLAPALAPHAAMSALRSG